MDRRRFLTAGAACSLLPVVGVPKLGWYMRSEAPWDNPVSLEEWLETAPMVGIGLMLPKAVMVAFPQPVWVAMMDFLVKNDDVYFRYNDYFQSMYATSDNWRGAKAIQCFDDILNELGEKQEAIKTHGKS